MSLLRKRGQRLAAACVAPLHKVDHVCASNAAVIAGSGGHRNTRIKSLSWRFAWQRLAGVRQAISDNVDLTIRYRFFNVSGVELTGLGGRVVDSDFRSHALMGGVTFNFW